MYHDEGWSFLQLGRYIERAQCAVALLLSQIDTGEASAGQEFYEADWISLLRIFHALEVYNHIHSADVQPHRVLGLLVQRPPAARVAMPLPQPGGIGG